MTTLPRALLHLYCAPPRAALLPHGNTCPALADHLVVEISWMVGGELDHHPAPILLLGYNLYRYFRCINAPIPSTPRARTRAKDARPVTMVCSTTRTTRYVLFVVVVYATTLPCRTTQRCLATQRWNGLFGTPPRAAHTPPVCTWMDVYPNFTFCVVGYFVPHGPRGRVYYYSHLNLTTARTDHLRVVPFERPHRVCLHGSDRSTPMLHTPFESC